MPGDGSRRMVFAGLRLRNVCYFICMMAGRRAGSGLFIFRFGQSSCSCFLSCYPGCFGVDLGVNERACLVWDLHLFAVLLVFLLFGQYPWCLGDHCAFLLKGGDSGGGGKRSREHAFCAWLVEFVSWVSWMMRIMPGDGLGSRKGIRRGLLYTK